MPRARIEALRSMPDAMLLVDQELDAGLGVCWLRNPEIAELIQEALLHFDGERYRLLAWCIMPNHVHVVAETIEGHSLSKRREELEILHFPKSQCAAGASRRVLGDRLFRPIHAQ